MDSVNIFDIIQTAALIAAVFVAQSAIKYQRATAKKDKTIALLMKDLEDELLTEGIKILREVHLDPQDDVAIYANIENKGRDKAISISNLLNYYENIAVGVKNDIYDVFMIKESQKTMIIGIYEQAEPFIAKVRKTDNNPNLYIEFEAFIQILKS